MSDARHKRKYPPGDRKEMTELWKKSVIDRLAENKAAGIEPVDQAALARLLDVHKTAIGKMLKPDTQASKLVEPICAILSLPLPLESRDDDDELAEAVRALPKDKRALGAKLLRTLL